MEEHKKLWGFDHEDMVLGSILHDDQVIVCCYDDSVRVLALESGEELHRLEHPSSCCNADVSPNKSLLAVACNSAVVLWDMKKVVKLQELKLCSEIHDLRFNPSGDRLIVGSKDGEIFKIEME